ncbi:MAG TPA: dihydrofolate reductase family protein [Candidatus Saccharimonadales bacterium]|nr:dihydrofolate reductase family protein [Candidatus Saccharimonadales bacterium]
MTNSPTVRLAAVVSLDGKITKDSKVHTREWISAEDKQLFHDLIAQSDVIICGRKTYRNMRPVMDNTKRYVVYTKSPASYRAEARAGSIDFTDAQPSQLVAQLAAEGCKNILITGGGAINTLFLQAQLVDELLVTIEPVIHGAGRPLLEEYPPGQALQLLELKQLNARGTVLLRYAIAH